MILDFDKIYNEDDSYKLCLDHNPGSMIASIISKKNIFCDDCKFTVNLENMKLIFICVGIESTFIYVYKDYTDIFIYQKSGYKHIILDRKLISFPVNTDDLYNNICNKFEKLSALL